jgi:hypothetical protein
MKLCVICDEESGEQVDGVFREAIYHVVGVGVVIRVFPCMECRAAGSRVVDGQANHERETLMVVGVGELSDVPGEGATEGNQFNEIVFLPRFGAGRVEIRHQPGVRHIPNGGEVHDDDC